MTPSGGEAKYLSDRPRIWRGNTRVSGTNMGPVFLFVFDRLNIDHYLATSSSIDGKFHALHRYIVEIGHNVLSLHQYISKHFDIY